MFELTAVIEPHRKGSKITIICSEHGRVGVRYLADEAKKLATDHYITHMEP